MVFHQEGIVRPSTTRLISVAFVVLFIFISISYATYTPWTKYWLDGKEFWYSLHWKGEKVGHVQLTFDLLNNNIFQVSQSTRVKTVNHGKNVLFFEKEVFHFDTAKKDELTSLFYHRQQDDYLEQTSLNKNNEVFVGNKTVENQTIKINLPLNSFTLADYLAMLNWSYNKPSAGDVIVTKRLDLSTLSLNDITYKQVNDQLYTFQEQGKSWHGSVDLNADRIPIRYSVGQMVVQQLTTKELALSANSQSDYYQSQVIAIDKPLGDTTKLEYLVITAPSASENIINDQRQYIDGRGDIHILNIETSKPVSDTNLQSYLDERLETNLDNVNITQQLVSLASSVVATSSLRKDKVADLISFVSSYLTDTVVVRPMSIATILDQKKGDCTEHTRLFIALARAIDIPAREVSGLVYLGDEVQGFGGHVWSEVIIDGNWVAVDPTWNLTKVSATHIQINENNLDNIFNRKNQEPEFSFSFKSATYYE